MTEYISKEVALEALLHAFVDHEDQPCSLDHHGYCQEHDSFSEGRCKVAEARELLSTPSLPVEALTIEKEQ